LSTKLVPLQSEWSFRTYLLFHPYYFIVKEMITINNENVYVKCGDGLFYADKVMNIENNGMDIFCMPIEKILIIHSIILFHIICIWHFKSVGYWPSEM